MENPGGWGGSYVKFPPWWGYGYFLEPHIAKRQLRKGSFILLMTTFFACVAINCPTKKIAFDSVISQTLN